MLLTQPFGPSMSLERPLRMQPHLTCVRLEEQDDGQEEVFRQKGAQPGLEEMGG